MVEYVERRRKRGAKVVYNEKQKQRKRDGLLQPSQVRTTFAIESREGAAHTFKLESAIVLKLMWRKERTFETFLLFNENVLR